MPSQGKSKTGNRPGENITENAAKSPNPPEPDAPTNEEIRARAYQIHLERGSPHGYDLDDWLEAERELKEKQAGAPTE